MTTAQWDYSSLRDKQGIRSAGSIAAKVAVIGLTIAGYTLTEEARVGADLEAKADRKQVQPRTVAHYKSHGIPAIDAVELSLGFAQSITHCSGNGTETSLLYDIGKAISNHQKFTIGIAPRYYKCSADRHTINISKWSNLVQEILGSYRRESGMLGLNSWSKYFMGFAFDEEASWKYANHTIVSFNVNMRHMLASSYFLPSASTNLHYWMYDVWAGGVPSWDTISAYKDQIEGVSYNAWRAPQLYSTGAQTFAESACQAHLLLCGLELPYVISNYVPPLSARMKDSPIPVWHTKWYEFYSFAG